MHIRNGDISKQLSQLQMHLGVLQGEVFSLIDEACKNQQKSQQFQQRYKCGPSGPLASVITDLND